MAWSRPNFGNTPVMGEFSIVGLADTGHLYAVELNWLAPLLGMMEEYGELLKAIAEKDAAEQLDALGDMGVYFGDYTARRFEEDKISAVQYPWGCPGATPLANALSIGVALGRLYHVELKRFQGIRGMADTPIFKEAHQHACLALYAALDINAHGIAGKGITALTRDVFTAVVAKRNWKQNNTNGQ